MGLFSDDFGRFCWLTFRVWVWLVECAAGFIVGYLGLVVSGGVGII